MRTTLNISMPHALKREVDNEIKAGNYASVSEFFRDTIRVWKEEKLLKELRESQVEIAKGGGKILHSLSDFD